MAPRSSTARRSPATIGGATSPSARTPSEWITLGSTAALGIWTLLIVFVPSVRFYLLWPGARTPLETLGILVAGMTGALAYLRYSLTGVRSSLLIALAFVVLAANQLVFGASVRALSGAPRELMLYLFTAGRIVAGILLLAGASRIFLPEREKPRKPLRVFVSSSAVSLGIVALTDGVLLAFRQHLPALSSGPVGNPSGELTRVTAPDLILGSLTAALYIAGSFAYLRRLRGRGDLVWLPGALVVAAFSQIHYMLFPVVSASRITTADTLRILFSAVLLFGLFRDIRLTYLSERARTRELAAAYRAERGRVQELEEATRRRAEMAQLVAHDMAHAVASLRTYTVALEKRWEELDDAFRREIVQWIERESGRLRELMEEASTMARLDSGEPSLATRPIVVADLINEAADSVDRLGGALRVFVEASTGTSVVEGDPTRLLQVFRNLLRNAELYSRPGTPVDLEVVARNGELLFSIRDRGHGIPKEDLPRLFKRFSRLRPAEGRDDTGSGLGLYISREIVEAHGGRIWVDSEPGKGSSFQFTLPKGPSGT
jgi:signal transduction histidine kinase